MIKLNDDIFTQENHKLAMNKSLNGCSNEMSSQQTGPSKDYDDWFSNELFLSKKYI